MKGIETMLNTSSPAGKKQTAIQAKDLHWREIDMLMWCMDSDGDCCIAVTPGKPPYRIRQEHVMSKPLEKVKKFIDAGLITYHRTEIYPKGACCDVYTITRSGMAFVNDYCNRNNEKNAEHYAAIDAKRDAQQRENWRTACHAELQKQFGVNLYLPSIYPEIVDSKCPFIDAPLPDYAPNGRDGQNISIREYLFLLWTRLLTDKNHKLLSDFFTWGEAIGYDDAIDMLRENSDSSAYDLFGLNDDTESDE